VSRKGGSRGNKICQNKQKNLTFCRWKRDDKRNVIVQGGKPVLQFIAIQRKDTKEWAIPGVRIYFRIAELYLFFK